MGRDMTLAPRTGGSFMHMINESSPVRVFIVPEDLSAYEQEEEELEEDSRCACGVCTWCLEEVRREEAAELGWYDRPQEDA